MGRFWVLRPKNRPPGNSADISCLRQHYLASCTQSSRQKSANYASSTWLPADISAHNISWLHQRYLASCRESRLQRPADYDSSTWHPADSPVRRDQLPLPALPVILQTSTHKHQLTRSAVPGILQTVQPADTPWAKWLRGTHAYTSGTAVPVTYGRSVSLCLKGSIFSHYQCKYLRQA